MQLWRSSISRVRVLLLQFQYILSFRTNWRASSKDLGFQTLYILSAVLIKCTCCGGSVLCYLHIFLHLSVSVSIAKLLFQSKIG